MHARIFLSCFEQSGTSASLPVWLTTRCAQRENSAAASGQTTRPCGITWGKYREFRRSCCRDEIAQLTRGGGAFENDGVPRNGTPAGATRRRRRDARVRRARARARVRYRHRTLPTERTLQRSRSCASLSQVSFEFATTHCFSALSRVAHRIAAVRRSSFVARPPRSQPSIERGTDARDASPERDARVVARKKSPEPDSTRAVVNAPARCVVPRGVAEAGNWNEGGHRYFWRQTFAEVEGEKSRGRGCESCAMTGHRRSFFRPGAGDSTV